MRTYVGEGFLMGGAVLVGASRVWSKALALTQPPGVPIPFLPPPLTHPSHPR